MDVYIPCKTNYMIADIVYQCFLASGIVSCLVHWGFLLHMLVCYRKHMRYVRACKSPCWLPSSGPFVGCFFWLYMIALLNPLPTLH